MKSRPDVMPVFRRCGVASLSGVAERVGQLAARRVTPGRRATRRRIEPIDLSPSRTKGYLLRDYQIEAAEWLRARDRALLGDEIGLGKTAEVLRAMRRRTRGLVVCPAYLKLVWRDECREWRPDLMPEVSEELRLPKRGELLIVSYNALPEAPQLSRMPLMPHLDMSDVELAVDEAHYCKDPEAARTRAIRSLVRQVGKAWPLTGTPLLNDPQDLRGVLLTFQLFQAAYDDEETFKEIFDVKNEVVGRRKKGGLVRKLTYGDVHQAEARDGLRRVMLRRLQRECLTLPPVIERTISVPAPDDLRELLDASLDAWDSWEDPADLPPFEMLSAARSALSTARIETVKEHVRRAIGEGPLLVFSSYRAPVLAMADIPRTRVITGGVSVEDRAQWVRDFQEGRIDCIAGTIDSMGSGLTMTRASRVVFVDQDYTPAMNMQALGRAVRSGQENRVLCERFVTDHPLDVRLAEILVKKMGLIDMVVGS